MAFTSPILPTLINQQSDSIQTADYTDTHRTMHARLLTGGRENVRAHGARGIAADNDTDTNAFIKAINNIKARAPSGTGELFIPAGYYIINGETIDAALTSLIGWRFIGEGYTTTIQIRAGAAFAFGGTGLIDCYFEGLQFNGNSKAGKGFRLRGNSQSNTFQNCKFSNCTTGISIEADGGNDQADKNLFLGCGTANNDVGIHVNSGNAQQQLWIGGNHASNGVSVRASLGWYHQIGGQIQHGGGTGTAYQLDTGTSKLILEDVITEAENISIDVQSMTSPAVIDLRNCVFGPQSTPTIVKGATGGSFKLIASGCTFNTGAINAGVSSVFQDMHNVYTGGAAWVPTTNSVRYSWSDQDFSIYIGSTTATRVINPAGYEDFDDMATPSAPAAGKLRLYHNSATGKLSVIDSSSVVSALY